MIAQAPIEALEGTLQRLYPNGEFSIDQPDNEAGSWFLDFCINGKTFAIEWKDGKFGICLSDLCYGEGPDEIYDENDFDKVISRIVDSLGEDNE